jgi:hypothetical protein
MHALYDGAAVTEPAFSDDVRLTVPAAVRLHDSPRHVSVGGTGCAAESSAVTCSGAAPQPLRCGPAPMATAARSEIPGVRRNHRFSTTWTFRPGLGVVKDWFSVSRPSEADYPVHPWRMDRVTVRVAHR